MDQKLDKESIKAAVADMQAAMDVMELADLTKAISEERRKTAWGKHPADIRLSIPLLFTRLYLVFAMGVDKRSKERIKEDRKTHPLMRMGNMVVIVLGVAVVGLAIKGVATLY